MASLGPAVNSLRSSLTLLNSSITILDDSVSDFPRLCKILKRQRHFELLPEPNLRSAQQSLADEIVPAIEQLISTAETYVAQLGRKEESLKARYELYEGRMSSNKRNSSLGERVNPPKRGNNEISEVNEVKGFEQKRLQQKKERLQYAIERLELQTKQRERELRRSMAFVRD